MRFSSFKLVALAATLSVGLPVAAAARAAAADYSYTVAYDDGAIFGGSSGRPGFSGGGVVSGNADTPIHVSIKVTTSEPARLMVLPWTPLNQAPNPLPAGVSFQVVGPGCSFQGAPGFWDRAYACDFPAGTGTVTAIFQVASSSPIMKDAHPQVTLTGSLYTGNAVEHPGGFVDVNIIPVHPAAPPTKTPTPSTSRTHGSATPTTAPATTPSASATATATATIAPVDVADSASPAAVATTPAPTAAPSADASQSIALASAPTSGRGMTGTTVVAAGAAVAAIAAFAVTARVRTRRRARRQGS